MTARQTKIEIVRAADVAGRIPARKDGAGYRTRGYCHGSADKPDSASLVFNDPPRPGEQSLHVHCFKCNPTTPAERDAIRHALQKATGLQLCLCPDCRGTQAQRQASQHAGRQAERTAGRPR